MRAQFALLLGAIVFVTFVWLKPKPTKTLESSTPVDESPPQAPTNHHVVSTPAALKTVVSPQGRPTPSLSQEDTEEEKKLYFTMEAAEDSFKKQKFEDAAAYAREALEKADCCKKHWNYGNIIHDMNAMLGRIALDKGNTALAVQYLLEAGKTKGSPQLDSFGPHMQLAQSLLDKGERKAVLEYLESCKSFWQDVHHQKELNIWISEIKAGKIPTLNYGRSNEP